MAEVIHLRCRHCGESYINGTPDYCPPCNTYLMYRALPILLGMLMLPPLQKQPAAAGSHYLRGRKLPYPHLKDIMD